MDHDLIRAYMQQRREPGTPRFHREIEAMIGRCARERTSPEVALTRFDSTAAAKW
jgi:hypothetical protein